MDDRAVFLSHDYEGMKRIIDSIGNLDERTKLILEMKNLLRRTLAQMVATDVMPVNYYLKKFEISEGNPDIVDVIISTLIAPIKESEEIKSKQYKEKKEKGNIDAKGDFVNVILEGKEIKIIMNEQNDTDLKLLFEDRKKDYRNDVKFLEQELEHITEMRKYGNESNILDGHLKKKEDETQRKKIKTSNEIIAEEVVKHWDNGVEVFEEIYMKISKNSKKIFKEELTKDQIKGKYQRYAAKHQKYKRDKY